MFKRFFGAFGTMRDLFWVLALGVLLVFGFFLALGAVHPGEMKWPTIGVIALAVLWVLHAWLQSRAGALRDPRMIHARERRGF